MCKSGNRVSIVISSLLAQIDTEYRIAIHHLTVIPVVPSTADDDDRLTDSKAEGWSITRRLVT